MVENVKLSQIIAKIDFSRIFQQKENFFKNLTPGCHGNVFVCVMSNSTNLAKISQLGLRLVFVASQLQYCLTYLILYILVFR